jgi:hypothetical protein
MSAKSKVLLIGSLIMLILGSACTSLALASNPAATPEEVTEAFIAWQIEHTGYDPETDTMHNPLADGSFRDAPYLSTEFADRVAAQIAAGELHASPFLCAQDVPTDFTLGDVNLSPVGEEARVPVFTSFEGHSFEVYLQLVEGEWQVSDVICTPAS